MRPMKKLVVEGTAIPGMGVVTADGGSIALTYGPLAQCVAVKEALEQFAAWVASDGVAASAAKQREANHFQAVARLAQGLGELLEPTQAEAKASREVLESYRVQVSDIRTARDLLLRVQGSSVARELGQGFEMALTRWLARTTP